MSKKPKSSSEAMVTFLQNKVNQLEKENYDLRMKVAELNARKEPRKV